MSLSNYDELVASIVNWLAEIQDDSLVNSVPDFITLAEAQMNKKLRTRFNVSRASAILNEEYEFLPDDYVVMIADPWIVHPNGRETTLKAQTSTQIVDLAPTFLTELRQSHISYYSIIGRQIRFSPFVAIDSENESDFPKFTLIYHSKVLPLSTEHPTSFVLDNFPDIYLYGSLMQAAPFLYEDDRAALWRGLFLDGIDDANRDYAPSLGRPIASAPQDVAVV